MREHTPAAPADSTFPTERVDLQTTRPQASVPWGSPPQRGAEAGFPPENRGPGDSDVPAGDACPAGDAFPGDVDNEPFVPAPRWRAGRVTKVLVGVCLVLAGGLGGAALQKAVDVRTAVTGRAGQTQFGTGTQSGTGGQTGTGGTGGGFGGRNRATQDPSAVPSAPAAP